jgi:hypothetical protein
MWNFYSIEQDVRQRHADELRRAEQARLLQRARAHQDAARRGPTPYRRLVYWFGGRLVSWGCRLQSHVERPELERALASAC